MCDPEARLGLGLAEARDRAAAILKAARQGRDSRTRRRAPGARRGADHRRRPDRRGMRRRIQAPHRAGGALRTATDIERRLKRALASKMDTAADDFAAPTSAASWITSRFARPARPPSSCRSVGAMYRWGISKGYVGRGPYGRGRKIQPRCARERTLSRSELRDLWNGWMATMPPDVVKTLKPQICTGARIGEVGGMMAEELHVDGARLIWTLPASRSKNKTARTTPLVGMAREIVEAALKGRGTGPLFRKVPIPRGAHLDRVGSALHARTLPCAHFASHDLRRTVVSMMDEMGIALDTIATTIGHQRGTNAERTLVRDYAKARLDDRVEVALSAWDARLREIIAGEVQPDNVVQLKR